MLHEIFEGIAEFFRALLTMLGLGSLYSGNDRVSGRYLRVYIKQAGRTISADLDPSWSVRKIKSVVAPKLDILPEELKIIFSGKELQDDMILQTCDVGQKSCLYAVRVQIQSRRQLVSESTDNVESEDDTIANTTAGSNENSTTGDDLQTTNPLTEHFEHTHVENLEANNESSSSTTTATTTPESLVPTVHKQSEFFVYCNNSSCEDYKEGKLRVRCATCQSGAFTVLRDPENWEDVLKPNQVPGSCETPGCLGSDSQFYFKCANHITLGEDDTAPPLPLIKRNPELVPCLACGDAKDPVFVFECPSQHVTCIDCFRQYITMKLSERQFIQDETIGYTVACPVLCKDSYVKDSNHFKLLGKYNYDRYQRFGTEEYVLKLGGVLCPQPDCGMGIISLDTGCNKVACVHGCGYVFCRLCLEGWHMGPCRVEGAVSTEASGTSSSNAYTITADRAASAQWDDVSRRAVRLTTKPCPKCRVPTERAAGCHHMACPKCLFEWCWLCQVKWGRDCQGNHWFG